LTRSLATHAYERLRQEIVECLLKPGEHLTEAVVAGRLEVGKMPAREALQRLVQEGLVQVIPRHGYAVAPITLRDVRELFDLRLVLEPVAAARAAGKIADADRPELERLSQIGYTVGVDESVRQYLRANTEFHTLIARLSGNRRIAAIVAGLLEECERMITYIIAAYPENSITVEEHKRLVKALEDGDSKLARQITVDHVRSTRDMVLRQVIEDPALGSTPIGK
jgi:DNA-binding GntR family transcriptional regulator